MPKACTKSQVVVDVQFTLDEPSACQVVVVELVVHIPKSATAVLEVLAEVPPLELLPPLGLVPPFELVPPLVAVEPPT